jgi:uncharacterized protein (TIGR03437 family)
MRKSALLMLALLVTAVAALGQPSINIGGVVNSASYIPPGLPNSGIAQGSLFIIKGKKLGACGTVVAGEFPLKTAMGGTSIKVGTRDAWMVYVVACRGKDAGGINDYPDQLAAVLPSDTPIGNAQVTVTYNGQTSAPVTAQIVRSTFGAFTINQGGTGPFVIQNFISQSNQPVNTRFVSASPNQTVILWGTGLGPITPSQDNGPGPVGNIAGTTVDVYVGGKKVVPTYFGRSPCCSGIDQIVFTVPTGVEGCNVPVTVVVNGIPSNFGTLSVAPAGQTCSDPNGYSAADLNRLASLQNIGLGIISLARVKMTIDLGIPGVPGIDQVFDAGFADFERLTQSQFMGGESSSGGITPGACYVTAANELVEEATLPRIGLDAGNAITAARQGGASKQLIKNALGGVWLKGTYMNDPTVLGTWIEPGNWTITGPGGPDVGAFSLNLVVPPNLTWDNRAQITSVTRSQGVTVTWSGGDPNSFVVISGSSVSGKAMGTFYCIERVPVKQFAVPAWVLAALPATGSAADEIGMMSVGTSSLPAKPAQLPTGLDYFIAVASSVDQKTVKFQ